MKLFIIATLVALAVAFAIPNEAGPEPATPIVEYPAAGHEEIDTKIENGVKMCKHFSPTAGQIWTPCEAKPNPNATDYRTGLGPQWCGNRPCKPEDQYSHNRLSMEEDR